MHAAEWIALATLLMILLGGFMSILRWFAAKDRERIDEESKEIRKHVEDLRRDLTAAELDLALLRERVSAYPTRQDLRELEDKLGAKLEQLGDRFQEMLSKAKFICPNAVIGAAP